MHRPKSWGQIYSTRVASSVADNLITHLGMYDPYQNPDEPINETGLSLNDIKARIKERLELVPKHYISARAMVQAIRYLTGYVINSIGEHDKQVNVFDYIDHFTTKYIKDKTASYWSGKPERSKIRTKKWMDRYFTPTKEEPDGTLKPSAGMTGLFKESILEEGTMVYVALDGDDMGKMVEEGLLTDDPQVAKKISASIVNAHKEIEKMTKAVEGEVVFDGGDNMLLFVPYDEEFFELCKKAYIESTEHTVTIGVGERPIQAHYSLVVGKNTGKDKIVVYSPEVEAQLEEIRENQKNLSGVHQQLKYKANISMDIGGILQNIDIPRDNEIVYATFIQAVKDYNLDDAQKITEFFAQPADELFAKVSGLDYNQVEKQLVAEGEVKIADGGSNFSNEERHTDEPQVISPKRKKVPSRKYNWLTQEDMNPELNKKENSGEAPHMRGQFSDNMPESQFSMGGEPGNAVAPY